MNSWMLLAFIAFFLNGCVLITQKIIADRYPGGENLFMACVFLAGTLLCGLVLVLQKRRPRFMDFAMGGLAGIVSFGGNLCLIRALSMSHSYLVLPPVFGIWMLVVAFASRFLFREPLGRRSVLAFATGVLAIVLLSVSGDA